MATITTINQDDLISDSRTDINTNFSNLNNDKIETSVIDTDTTLAANSDSKIATQKAVKTFVEANVNPTGRSWNEYAADAGATDAYAITLTGLSAYTTGMTFKFKANTANTGACTLNVNGLGAKTIKKNVSDDLSTGDILANQLVIVTYDGTNMQLQSLESGVAKTADLPSQTHSIGALDNNVTKTYFNIQLPFTLWTGGVDNDTSTGFDNWVRSSSDIEVTPMGSFIDVVGTDSDNIYLRPFKSSTNLVSWNSTNKVILDWWAKLPSSGTGSVSMGFGTEVGSFGGTYDATAAIGSRVQFVQTPSGVLYAVISEEGVGNSNTDISSGITVTNWNNYRIEFDLTTDAKFYVNGVLKATLSGANLEVDNFEVYIGFGRSGTSLFRVSAPTLSLEMNP